MQKKNFLENLWESLSNLDKAKAGSYALFIPEFVVMYVLMRYIPSVKVKGNTLTLPWMVVIPVRGTVRCCSSITSKASDAVTSLRVCATLQLATIILGAIRDDDTSAYFEYHDAAATMNSTQLEQASLVQQDSYGWVLPTLKTQYGDMDTDIISLPKWSVIDDCDDKFGLILAGLSVCIVAVLETLISAKIAEIRCTGENCRSDFGEVQELAAMSGGQLLSGLFGGKCCYFLVLWAFSCSISHVPTRMTRSN
jgi:MFS superfamily sulfate permease-like transporter